MSSENPQTTNNTWQPDPAWDYYMIWHKLQRVKAKIDQALKVLNQGEIATVETDEEVREILEPLRGELTYILDNELDNSSDDVDDEDIDDFVEQKI